MSQLRKHVEGFLIFCKNKTKEVNKAYTAAYMRSPYVWDKTAGPDGASISGMHCIKLICFGIILLVIHISLKYLDQLTPINCFFSFSKRLNSFLKTGFSLISKLSSLFTRWWLFWKQETSPNCCLFYYHEVFWKFTD